MTQLLPKKYPVRHGRQKRPSIAELSSSSDTHNNGEVGFPCAHCHRAARSVPHSVAANVAERILFAFWIRLKTSSLPTLPTPKFCINFLGLVSHIKLDLFEVNAFWCPWVLETSFAEASSLNPPLHQGVEYKLGKSEFPLLISKSPYSSAFWSTDLWKKQK